MYKKNVDELLNVLYWK